MSGNRLYKQEGDVGILNFFEFKDLHGAWENVTLHHAPLYMPSGDREKGLSVVRVVVFYFSDFLTH